jgi:hypothetical protein
VSDTEPEETPQIPVDAPAAEAPPPDAADRVDMVSPEPAAETEAHPAAAAVPDDFASQHPEALVAGAFAGAFVLAKLLQRITSR